MEVNFLLFSKTTVQIFLFFLFLAFFGLPSYKQYQKEETLVIKTEVETEGIEVPAVTIQVIHIYNTFSIVSLRWSVKNREMGVKMQVFVTKVPFSAPKKPRYLFTMNIPCKVNLQYHKLLHRI